MGMMDLYADEKVAEELEKALALKEEFIKEAGKLDNYIFILKYFLATGESLDPDVIEIPEEI